MGSTVLPSFVKILCICLCLPVCLCMSVCLSLICLYVCLASVCHVCSVSVCVSVHVCESISLSVCLCVYLSVCVCVFVSVCPSLFVCLSLCVCLCVCVCLGVFHVCLPMSSLFLISLSSEWVILSILNLSVCLYVALSVFLPIAFCLSGPFIVRLIICPAAARCLCYYFVVYCHLSCSSCVLGRV